MLVLGRTTGERIRIGDGVKYPFVWVEVVDIGRGKIRLGIDGPRDVPIYREEVIPVEKEAPR